MQIQKELEVKRKSEGLFQDAKLEASIKLDPVVDGWAFAKDSMRVNELGQKVAVRHNIRILLTTLHTIVWPESGWKQVNFDFQQILVFKARSSSNTLSETIF